MDWQQFVMHLEALDPEEIETVFMRHGACSVTLSDAGNDPVLEPGLGETPLWSQTRITGLFPEAADLESLRSDLLTALRLDVLPPHRVESLADRAWEREWLKDFKPIRFGDRLWVCPGGHQVDDANAVVLKLDPGLAFGTGTHPTTALCLEWLDSLPLRNRALLDYGCGSGILAVAALKLGCAAATAVDNDPQAITATWQNALNNDVSERLTVQHSNQPIDGHFDLVIANILAGPLIEFAKPISSSLANGGLLTLSGVLCDQAAEVMAAYEPWIEFQPPVFRAQEGQTWARLTGTRR